MTTTTDLEKVIREMIIESYQSYGEHAPDEETTALFLSKIEAMRRGRQ
jgi:hypothetical protein